MDPVTKDDFVRNLNTPPVDVKHAELKRFSEESAYKSVCPFCSDGLLLLKRDNESLKLSRFDRCIACGRAVCYLDDTVNGEGFEEDGELCLFFLAKPDGRLLCETDDHELEFMWPVADRNNIHSLYHSTDKERSDSWLKWIREEGGWSQHGQLHKDLKNVEIWADVYSVEFREYERPVKGNPAFPDARMLKEMCDETGAAIARMGGIASKKKKTDEKDDCAAGKGSDRDLSADRSEGGERARESNAEGHGGHGAAPEPEAHASREKGD